MRRFEYKTLLLPAAGGTDLAPGIDDSELNALGAEGWEAFAAVPAALDGYAYAVTTGLHVLLRRSSDS